MKSLTDRIDQKSSIDINNAQASPTYDIDKESSDVSEDCQLITETEFEGYY